MERKERRFEIPGPLISDCVIREAPNPAQLILLLHGYSENGRRMFRHCEPALPENATVLAPNAPYPIPRRSEHAYQVGFSWYFHNPITDEYLIDMTPASTLIEGLVRESGSGSLPITIIGFSQGGYLAPFAAIRLRTVTRVIGIASRFLEEELTLPLPFRADAIHGALDETVDPAGARTSHAKLKESGMSGDFHLLPGSDHSMTPEMQTRLRELLHGQSESPAV